MNCPDETQLTRFARGGFAVEEISGFEAHLDHCDRCLALVADVAKASGESSSPWSEPKEADDSAFVHLLAALARRSDRAPEAEAPPLPDRFGPYRVVGVLGRGAMGIVYRAVDEASGRNVAIKTVARPNPRLLSAVRQEIAFLERKRHPGIVQVFENGVIDGDPWYAMELLAGRTLEQFNGVVWQGIRRTDWRSNPGSSLDQPLQGGVADAPAAGGRLTEVLALFARICEPLGFIHGEGIVHCDLKPANVFVRDEGRPVLLDFGLLSRAGGAIGRETLEVGGHLRGTLPYLAPELIRRQIPDARADLYALGCILFESITGRTPFVATTVRGFLEAHLHAEPPSAARFVSGVPAKLDQLLTSLLAKRPDQRIGAADAVAELLSGVLETMGSSTSRASSSTPYLFRPRIVGREAAIERLLAAWAQAEGGDGRLVVLGGESGIGKTFLASELAQRVARTGSSVVTGECMPVAAIEHGGKEVVGAALQPFRALLQSSGDRCRDASPEDTLRLFGSRRSIALLARYEPALAYLVDPAAEETLAPLPPSAERERVLDALSDLLERTTARSPLLLVIDDLQWADDLSLAFLHFLADRLAGRRLMVLALYRSEEASTPVTELAKKDGVLSFPLDRLDAAALKVLVGDLLADQPSDTFIRALEVHSEGNPFFVAEYLRAGATEGLLRRTAEGGWRLAQSGGALDYDALTLPASLQALLERRLSALRVDTQRLTEAAAVLGRECPLAMLSPIAGIAPENVPAAVAEMFARQVAQGVPGEALRFLHDKLREAAYGRIDRTRRASLHLAAANIIERTYADRPELPSHYAELAYHLRQGGQASRALDYFERAGAHALRASADADAVRCFREAGELAGGGVQVSDARRGSWERMTGDALYGLGQLEAATMHLRSAVALLGWPMPKRSSEIASSILAKLAQQALHRAVPRPWIEAEPTTAASLLQAARAYARLEQIHYYRGEYLPLFVATLSSLNLSERAGTSSHLAFAYTNAGAAAGIMPLHRTASHYFALAQATLEEAYDVEVESYLRLGHGVYLAGLAQWDRAVASCKLGQDLAERLGFRRRWEELTAVRALATRDFDERLDLLARTAASATQRSDAQTASWGLLNQAEVLLARGDRRRAAACVGQVESTLPHLGLPEQTLAFAQRALILVDEGDVAAAAATADRATELVNQAKPVHFGNIDAYARIAEVQLAAWAVSRKSAKAERKASARAACANLASAARVFPIAMPSHCLHEGARRWLGGRHRDAVTLWERGISEARRLALPFREAQLLVTLGTHLPDAGPAAEALDHGRRLAARHGVEDPSLRCFRVGHNTW